MRGKINRPTPATEESIEDARSIRRAIRNGIKTDRDTQPVQVRMLKAQIAVLKQIAALENRTTSDIVRMLVDGYIEHCQSTWPQGDEADILARTIRLNDYENASWTEKDLRVFTTTSAWVPEGFDVMTDDRLDSEPSNPYEQYTEKDAK